MKKIAEELYKSIEEGTNPTQYTTKSGLTITLGYADSHGQRFWRLSLTKRFHQADAIEREKAREAFNIPNDTQWMPTYDDGWGIIRYTWIEDSAEQMHIKGLGSDPEFNNWQEDPGINNWQEKYE